MTANSSLFDQIGGAETVARLVDRFYDLMDGDPAYAELRVLHDEDLRPMRRSLSGFLTGWLGGPRDWFDANPGRCMMSVHAPLAVESDTADQWTDAMAVALRDTVADQQAAARIDSAFRWMAAAMVRR